MKLLENKTKNQVGFTFNSKFLFLKNEALPKKIVAKNLKLII